jgi:hypothetical protein
MVLRFTSVGAAMLLALISLHLDSSAVTFAANGPAVPDSRPAAPQGSTAKREPATTQAGCLCEVRLERSGDQWFCALERTNTSGRSLRLHRWPQSLTVQNLTKPGTRILGPDEILPDGTVVHTSTEISNSRTWLFPEMQEALVTLYPGETLIKRLPLERIVLDSDTYRVSLVLIGEDGARVRFERTVTPKP